MRQQAPLAIRALLHGIQKNEGLTLSSPPIFVRMLLLFQWVAQSVKAIIGIDVG